MNVRYHAILLTWLALLAWPVAAQALKDPTRPPANLLGTGAAAAVAAPSAPRLQSVLIARHEGGRHVAVIDGQTVRVGDKVRGAVVERMSETEVVLLHGRQRQVLQLFPTSR